MRLIIEILLWLYVVTWEILRCCSALLLTFWAVLVLLYIKRAIVILYFS